MEETVASQEKGCQRPILLNLSNSVTPLCILDLADTGYVYNVYSVNFECQVYLSTKNQWLRFHSKVPWTTLRRSFGPPACINQFQLPVSGLIVPGCNWKPIIRPGMDEQLVEQ